MLEGIFKAAPSRYQSFNEVIRIRVGQGLVTFSIKTNMSSFPLAESTHLSLSLTLTALFKRGHCQHEHEVAVLISSRFTGPLAPVKETPSHLVAQIGKPLCPVAIANIFEA